MCTGTSFTREEFITSKYSRGGVLIAMTSCTFYMDPSNAGDGFKVSTIPQEIVKQCFFLQITATVVYYK